MKIFCALVLVVSFFTSCSPSSGDDSAGANDRVRSQGQTCSVAVPVGSRTAVCNSDYFGLTDGASTSYSWAYRIYSVVTGQLVGANDTLGFSSLSDCEKSVAASNQIVCNYDKIYSANSMSYGYRAYSLLNNKVIAGSQTAGYSSLSDCLNAISSTPRTGVTAETIRNSDPSAKLCEGVPAAATKSTICNYDSANSGGRSGYKIYSTLSGRAIASADTMGFSSSADCALATGSSLLLVCNYDYVGHTESATTSYSYGYYIYSVVTGLPVKTLQSRGYSTFADCVKAISDK